MVVAYQGTVQDGQIRMENDPVLPEGASVIVVLVEEATSKPKPLTMGELLESPLVGMWADRDDIQDSVTFAEELRRKAEQRGSEAQY